MALTLVMVWIKMYDILEDVSSLTDNGNVMKSWVFGTFCSIIIIVR